MMLRTHWILLLTISSGLGLSGCGSEETPSVSTSDQAAVITERARPEILKPVVDDMQESTKQSEQTDVLTQTKNQTKQLKQIGLAFHYHHDIHRALPGAGSNFSGEQKGLSWRVHILPFLREKELYAQFHLDEPWDSEHNKPLVAQMPDVFKSHEVTEEGKTAFHVVEGEDIVFSAEKAVRFRDITDGTSNTILAIQTASEKADFWTKPGGLTLDEKDPVKTFGTPDADGFLTLFCDGHVRAISGELLEPENLKALFTRNGGGGCPRITERQSPVSFGTDSKIGIQKRTPAHT